MFCDVCKNEPRQKSAQSPFVKENILHIHTADMDFVSDYLPLFAHVQKALPVDKISKVSHFVINCEK